MTFIRTARSAVLMLAAVVAGWHAEVAWAEHPHHRAGHPECVACYAQHSNKCHYSGSFVGGGVATHGCGRYADQGTWGWDYCGSFFKHRPWLRWSQGRRHQGGSGAYKSEGPHYPDPIGILGL